MKVHDGIPTTHNEAQILLLAEEGNGVITSTQVTEAGIPRRCLSSMVRSGLLIRAERGVYTLPETWEDELYILQWRFSQGIYSHETALYLHAMTDRTPAQYTMTFPFGYNPRNVIQRGIFAKTTTKKTYSIGIMTRSSPSGNPIKVYNIERTLCDIVSTRHKADIQVVNQAMNIYVNSKEKNIARLMEYAEIFRVTSRIQTYMEILL